MLGIRHVRATDVQHKVQQYAREPLRAALRSSTVSFASGDGVPAGAKFACFRNTEDGSQVLTADTERLSYVNKSPPERLMLAVVNKTTGVSHRLCAV